MTALSSRDTYDHSISTRMLGVPVERSGSSASVTIRFGIAPRPPGATTVVAGAAADARHFWIDVPDIARILVSNGDAIVVEPARNATEQDIRAFLLGSAMGALLLQRGLLPLHASAVSMGHGGVAFMGTSGAGKSTVAAHLISRGHGPVSDDICAIAVDTRGATLHPGPRRLKLWEGSLAAIGLKAAGLARVLPNLDKYQLLTDAPPSADPITLETIVLLERDDAVGIEPVAGAAAAAALIANTFRGELVAPMGASRKHFDQCLALARRPGVVRLRRPWAIDRLDEASDAIERWIEPVGPTWMG